MSEWWSWRGIGSKDDDGTIGLRGLLRYLASVQCKWFGLSLVFRWNERAELPYHTSPHSLNTPPHQLVDVIAGTLQDWRDTIKVQT